MTRFTNILGASLALAFTIAFILVAILLFEVWMFVDVILNKQISDQRRIIWAIGMILIHPFVAIGYYFTDYKKRTSI